jgi:hypothetical protein
MVYFEYAFHWFYFVVGAKFVSVIKEAVTHFTEQRRSHSSKLTQQNALVGKLTREADKSIVLEVKKKRRRNTLPENCFTLDISVARSRCA